ncbi:MAG: VWA domain-containing protein [Planctomycetota bacterium]|nr:VWA domain-containing protein [Planctomycetota bacterium]
MSRLFLRLSFAVALCAPLVLLSTPRGALEAKEPTLNERVSSFKKAIRSKDPKENDRSFELLRGAREPEVVDQLTWGLRQVDVNDARVRKEQEDVEAAYEKLFDDLEQAKMQLDASGYGERETKRYNSKSKDIGRKMDGAVKHLKNLENDYVRHMALRQQAILVAAELLGALEGDAFNDAFGRLTQQWLQAKDLADKLRWFDAVAEVGRPPVTVALQAIMRNAELDSVLRVQAIDALAARRDGQMMAEAIEMLTLPVEAQQILIAAIRALRTMHDKRCIEPLMDFLAREDIKRSRTDAHMALVSLTGVDHGPYPGQWKKWWEDTKATFTMPPEPRPTGRVKAPEDGKTFYGIHTFSDKILFIVDISGSMDKEQAGAQGKTKIDILKQELIGTVFNLNPTDTFNVILFNHAVIPWQQRKVDASERNKKMLKEWVEAQKPMGGTNIHDALEMGFRIAYRVTGAPDLDTIFFLTDGKPTAGKIREPLQILDVMRAWNEQAHLTIHTIGIGDDHDEAFLEALAKIGDGTYLKR